MHADDDNPELDDVAADELDGLRDLHGTLDAAIEVLAAFLAAAADARIPSEALIDDAHEVVGDLAEWRATLAEIDARNQGGEGLH